MSISYWIGDVPLASLPELEKACEDPAVDEQLGMLLAKLKADVRARAIRDCAHWLDSFGGRAYYESDYKLGQVIRRKVS